MLQAYHIASRGARMDALEGNRLSDANSVGVGHGPVNDEFKEIVRN